MWWKNDGGAGYFMFPLPEGLSDEERAMYAYVPDDEAQALIAGQDREHRIAAVDGYPNSNSRPNYI